MLPVGGRDVRGPGRRRVGGRRAFAPGTGLVDAFMRMDGGPPRGRPPGGVAEIDPLGLDPAGLFQLGRNTVDGHAGPLDAVPVPVSRHSHDRVVHFFANFPSETASVRNDEPTGPIQVTQMQRKRFHKIGALMRCSVVPQVASGSDQRQVTSL